MPSARFLSIIVGVAVVVIGVRLAQRLVGWFGALTTGLVLSLSPLLIEHSIKVTPDIFLTLFSALALVSFIDVYEKGRWRDYLASGVWIGLGVASKYTPILLLSLFGCRSPGQTLARRSVTKIVRLAIASRRSDLRRDIFPGESVYLSKPRGRETRHPLAVHARGHRGSLRTRAGAWRTLVLPGERAARCSRMAGRGLGTFGTRTRSVAPARSLDPRLALLHLLLRGTWRIALTPCALRASRASPVALGLAGLVGELEGTIAAHGRRYSTALALGLLLLVVLTPPGVRSARQSQRYSRPSTLQEAKQFILQELNRPNVSFAAELGGPDLPRSAAADFSRRPVFKLLDASSRERLLRRPSVHRFEINMYMSDANGADLYYDLRHYLNYD